MFHLCDVLQFVIGLEYIHQCHRTGIAYESSYGSRDAHHHDKDTQLAVACHLHDFSADFLCQSGLEDGTSHDKQSYHHNHHMIRKPAKASSGVRMPVTTNDTSAHSATMSDRTLPTANRAAVMKSMTSVIITKDCLSCL